MCTYSPAIAPDSPFTRLRTGGWVCRSPSMAATVKTSEPWEEQESLQLRPTSGVGGAWGSPFPRCCSVTREGPPHSRRVRPLPRPHPCSAVSSPVPLASQGWRDSLCPAACPRRVGWHVAAQGHSETAPGPPPHRLASLPTHHPQASPLLPPPASHLLPLLSLPFKGPEGRAGRGARQRGPVQSPGTRILFCGCRGCSKV